ncbi:glycoside hydrolase family 15 protein [Alkalihalobacillus sp. TS-13]|uniref:glycoside hydrolase family 15 protein n=1 Tax=Alkalihalobacillus sp. TS-13 TaxID=2842455 RepID=UPI001C868173|nr:glycoside hydrolase family 15 protein [Alkalihalobacillus sp. TS-13]
MEKSKLYDVLETMRLSNGAFLASPSKHYSYVWIRDVCYAALPFLYNNDDRFEKAYYALFDLFKTYEWKIDIHRFQKPVHRYEYIHARYSTDLKELPVEWGHAQHDAIGSFLWGIGAGLARGKKMIRDEKDREMVQKLVDYLNCVQYWSDEDNGMWEEYQELHASSVGACVAGLKQVRMLVNVPEELIKKGEESLKFLLPRESETKETDLALLSLIYPYQIVSRQTALDILANVTGQLERKYGCIRYARDQYFNEGSEAEWCFGFPWLGLCYGHLGDMEKVEEYVKKTESIVPIDGKVPELYIGGRFEANENTPLAWAVAMSILLFEYAEALSSEKNDTKKTSLG